MSQQLYFQRPVFPSPQSRKRHVFLEKLGLYSGREIYIQGRIQLYNLCECHLELDQWDMVRSHTVLVWTHYLPMKSLKGGEW